MENAVARAIRAVGGPTEASFVCRVSSNTIHGGATRKSLGCGGLNVGGGASTVAEGPTPGGAEAQFNIAGGPVYAVSARTSAPTGSARNCSDTGCQFGPYLPIANAGTSTCVRNTFGSPGSGSLNSTTGVFSGSIPLSSEVFLTANGTAPCPRCVAGVCQIGWTSGVGASPTDRRPLHGHRRFGQHV